MSVKDAKDSKTMAAELDAAVRKSLSGIHTKVLTSVAAGSFTVQLDDDDMDKIYSYMKMMSDDPNFKFKLSCKAEDRQVLDGLNYGVEDQYSTYTTKRFYTLTISA